MLRGIRYGVAAIGAVAVAVALAGCGQSSPAGFASAPTSASAHGRIVAVGAESQYANVISQIGGRYVDVTAIMSDPNTDPHTFEASADVSRTVQAASLVVQNGLGYDDFMGTIEQAAPNPARRVIDVQQLRGLPDSTPNPHLWYDPATMPLVAHALVKDLSAIQPSHASYFKTQGRRFLASLARWTRALAAFKRQYGGTGVATTEPVADYLLQAAGLDIKTPWSLQAAVMNDTDPAPQDLAAQDSLFSGKQVKVFVYNQQVTDDITTKFLGEARSAGIPVVGVYETMPAGGYTYQSWMMTELDALKKAIASGTSTEKL